MEKLASGECAEALSAVRRKHGAELLFVYLCEAHAIDTWPLSPAAPRSHRDLSERVGAASAFLERWPALRSQLRAWYVDDMDDATTVRNGFWPERFVLLRHGEVAWASVLSEKPGCLLEELGTAAAAVFA